MGQGHMTPDASGSTDGENVQTCFSHYALSVSSRGTAAFSAANALRVLG